MGDHDPHFSLCDLYGFEFYGLPFIKYVMLMQFLLKNE